MGHRLSKIYTRTGDDGSTGLADGSRVTKDSPRVVALGDVDELNCAIGVLLTEPLPDTIRALLTGIQHELFDLGGELATWGAMPGVTLLHEAQIAQMENTIDELNAELGPLKEFILPGGTRAAALTHLARAVCRRAERQLNALAGLEAVSTVSRKYLNRLSDLLFVLGRELNRLAGCGDVMWQKNRGG